MCGQDRQTLARTESSSKLSQTAAALNIFLSNFRRRHKFGLVTGHSDQIQTVFALAVMEYAVDVSKFGKNPKTLLVHQY